MCVNDSILNSKSQDTQLRILLFYKATQQQQPIVER